MKKLHQVLCALLCLILLTAHLPARADSLRDAADLINAYAGLLGVLAGDDDETVDEPEEEPARQFTGPRVSVKVGKKVVKVHKSFKKAMDDYEAFFDSYIEFMKHPDMSQYSRFLAEYTAALAGLEELNDYDLSDAELAYYLEVYGRIMGKLADY